MKSGCVEILEDSPDVGCRTRAKASSRPHVDGDGCLLVLN